MAITLVLTDETRISMLELLTQGKVLGKGDVQAIEYTQAQEEKQAKALSTAFGVTAENIEKTSSGKGKQPFDSDEKIAVYGDEYKTQVEVIRAALKAINTVLKNHGHEMKVYIDYTGKKSSTSSTTEPPAAQSPEGEAEAPANATIAQLQEQAASELAQENQSAS